MKANELRIGNLVKYAEIVMRVTSISAQIVTLKRRSITVTAHIDKIEPIALTEEWLLKFGFKQSEYEEQCYCLSGLDLKWGYRYLENEPNWHYGHDYEHGGGMSCLWQPIKFVHQLQNLYFALNGEELEIRKEKS